MSQISQILEYIKSINERLNLWASNAKKVQELPAMVTLNPEALLIVSETGTSKKLEIQQIIDAVSLDGQNNTIREVLLGEITEFQDLNYLFDNNGIIVSESEIVMLSVLETINGIKSQRQFLWKLGKGTFNPIGSTNLNTKVLELQSKFIDEVLADDLTAAPDAIVYDLGIITSPILDVLNGAVPSLNYADEEKIYYIRATEDDVNLLYNFIGVNGIYGDADLQMVDSDLVLVYSSENVTTSNYVDKITPQTIIAKKTFQANKKGSAVIVDSSGVEFHTKTPSDSSSNVKLVSSNATAGNFTQTLQAKNGILALQQDINDALGLKEDKSQKGVAGGYVPLDEFAKIVSDYLTIVNDLVTGGATALASAETVKTLKTQIDGINTILTSNDVNLDTVQEVVDAIKTVQTSLSTILVNDLTTGGTTKALTAEMGKTLKTMIDNLVVPKASDTLSGTVKTDQTEVDPVVYTKATTDNLLKAKVNAILEIKPITGIAYTLTAYDTENLVQLAYDGTLPMTVTIPNDATLNLPIGSIFYSVGSNTGAVTIAGGAGVTFQTAVGLTAGQNETRKYVKKAANIWQVEGGAVPLVTSSNIVRTYYIDTINGNDTTAQEGNINKPFKTIDKAYLFFEQYGDYKFNANHIIHLMTSGTYYINNAITGYNVVIKSSAKCVISFQNNPDSLVINADNLEIDAQWSNLIFSTIVGQRISCGFLSLNLQEINGGFASDRFLFTSAGFYINVKKMIVNSRVITFSSSSSTVKYMNYFKCPYFIVSATNTLFNSGGFNYYTTIDLRGYVQTSGHVIIFSDIADGELLLKNITVSSGDLVLGYGNLRMKTVFNNSIISGVAFLEIGSYANTQHILTGVLDPTSAPIGGVNYDTTGTLIFDNFSGKLHSGFVLGRFNLKVNNSHLTTDGVPFGRTYWIAGKKREFFGANSIYSTTPTVIFGGDYVDSIDFYYPLKTNIPALGTSAVAVNKTTVTYP